MPVALRIVNDVSYAMRINHEVHFAWQAQYLLVAPRIVNDVSYVMRINHKIHFAWQVQYLVSWKGDFTGSANCKRRFMCEADRS